MKVFPMHKMLSKCGSNFCWTDFVASIILSHVITESSIILSTYLVFLQLHIAVY